MKCAAELRQIGMENEWRKVLAELEEKRREEEEQRRAEEAEREKQRLREQELKQNTENWCETVLAPALEEAAKSGEVNPTCVFSFADEEGWWKNKDEDSMRCLEHLEHSRYAYGWYDYRIKESISCDYLKSYLAQFCIVAEKIELPRCGYHSYGLGVVKGHEWKFYIDPSCGK